jgi:hypothetical protein
MKRIAVALGVVVLVLSVSVWAQNTAQTKSGSNVGTWELNIAKSNYISGTAPKSVTLTIAAAGAGFKHSVDVLNADSTVQHWETIGNYDGKDCPVIGNNANADMIARTRVDVNTLKSIYKKGGKVTTTATSVVSGNGKTMTVTTTGTNASGQAVNNVAVYDKQTNIGTWKLNFAKSKIPADKVPKSASFKVEAAGAGIKATVDSVSADGVVRHWELTGKYDGKDNPITGNCQYGDIVALARVDANTTTSTYKMGGKVNMTQTLVMSSDEKTLTITGTSKNAEGHAVNSVVVYDRQ